MDIKHTLLNALTRLTLSMVSVVLVACGGGGGSGGGDGSAQPAAASQSSVVLSGTIYVPEAHTVDNDVNDPQGQSGARNNPLDSSEEPGRFSGQVLGSNPVAVVGYVNRAGEGPDGASRSAGDVDDYYRVELRAGQVVTLSFLDAEGVDLDLNLYDGAGDVIIDSSLGLTGREQVQITEDGSYVIDVFAHSGASNYVLTVGLAGAESSYTSVNLRHEFISGEVLVAKTPPSDADFGSYAETGVTGFYGTGAAVVERWVLPAEATGWPSESLAPYLYGDGYQDKAGMVSAALLGKWQTLMHLKALGRRADVALAAPNARVQASALPDDPRYLQQWHYPLINLPQAWDISTGQREAGDVIIAVVDSGILLGHPDLQGQLVEGYDFVSNVANAGDGDGRDPVPEDVKPSGHHGTHVAGTIAALSDNGSGVAGVAWHAKIMPLRAIGLYGGSTADVLEAVKFAAGLPNVSGRIPPRRADIINLSLGTANDACLSLPVDPISEQVFRQVRDAGVIVIAAAGNNNCGKPSYPAGFDSVVSVSAVGLDRTRAGYSNYGSTIDIAAPGGGVTDLNGDGATDFVISTLGFRRADGRVDYRYGGLLGTSMAAPHVSGVVALMLSVAGRLTPEQLDNLIRSGQITNDLGSPGRDDLFGYGLVDAYQAVLAAGGAQQVLEPELMISPRSLNFGRVQTMLPLNLSNEGDGEVTVESVVAGERWLTVVPPDTTDGLGQYRIVVDRAKQADGNYFTSLFVESSLGARTIPVAMRVSRGAASVRDAGRHYVLLIDAETDRVVDSVAVESEGGLYRYRFSSVEGGRDYVIVAGTDLDNDLFVCSGADACGAYPSWSEPQRITVGAQSISGLDFTTRYLIPLSRANAIVGASPAERSALIPGTLERRYAR